MQREQQHNKDLQLKNEQQKKVLKVKTDEVNQMQRRFRSVGGAGGGNGTQQTTTSSWNRLEEQKKWLDSEVEKMLEHKSQLNELAKVRV